MKRMGKFKEFDNLEEFLETARGTMTIDVNGMVPHITGDMNDAGAIMAVFGAVKSLELTIGMDFEKATDILKQLNNVMNYKIVNYDDYEKLH